MPENTILNVTDLTISFYSNHSENIVVNNISYNLNKNEIVGIVGESGSGKSVSTLAILGLLPKKVSQISNGSIEFNGQDLIKIRFKNF